MRNSSLLVCLCLFLLVPAVASAHVTIENREAAVGGPFKVVFRVPHGCGTSPTTKLRVRIPQGVIGVKPMPKSGWQLDVVNAAYGKSYRMFHDPNVSEGAQEVAWSGRLPNEHYDEFVLSVYLTDELVPGTTLYFPVVQECESGVHRWIEIPEGGKSPSDYPEPAPGVKLLPKR
jgi:uncharacterized protein YcnI